MHRLLWLIGACMALGACTSSPEQDLAEPLITYQDLFSSTPDGAVACYRIPALVTAPNGDLIAAIDERVPSCADLRSNRDINIVLRRSSDAGATWSDIERVVDFPLGQSASDPSMIVDVKTGEIVMFYNFMDLDAAPGRYRMHLIRSTDHGQTWSAPEDLTAQITKPEWNNDFQFITSGRGLQTESGRLLHTLVNLERGLHLFGSDDHGLTWFLLDTPLAPGDESKVIELADGQLMVNSRVNDAGLRYIHTSADGGQTWHTRPDSTLIDPGCNASLLRYPGDEDRADLLLFSNANSATERTNLTIRVSRDQGATWPAGRTVYAGEAAYSSMTVLANGEIGVLFERDDYTITTFARFPLAWLTSP
ncbi:MAG: sialidase family protein [Rhodothermales bacterium]